MTAKKTKTDNKQKTETSLLPPTPLWLIGCLHDLANVQQTSSIISTCTLNTFAGSLLDVCRIVQIPHEVK